MRRFQRKLAALALFALVTFVCGQSAHAQLITSWEGDPTGTAGTPDGLGVPNGWVVSSASTASLAIASDPGMTAGNQGVTDGDQSLSIDFTGLGSGSGITHFDRPLRLDVPNPGPLYDLFNEVAAAPALYKLRFDVTVDPASFPTFDNVGEETPFVALGSFASSGSFGEVFNVAAFDPTFVTEITTFGAEVDASSLNLTPDANFYQLGFNVNGNWDLGDNVVFFMDNLRFDLTAPDLDSDTDVDEDDWLIFMASHKGDLSSLTPEQQFLAGDLDGDGDNDFDDFVLFEQGYDAFNAPGSFAAMLAAVPEPTSLLLGTFSLLVLTSARVRQVRAVVVLLAATLGVTLSTAVTAQQLHTFESDLDGWMNVDFGYEGVILGRSATGATEGGMAMSIQQPEDGFSWNAQVNYGSGTPGFNVWGDAIDLGPELFELQFDVTYDTQFVPQAEFPTFTNLSLALNSNAGWSQLDNIGESDAVTDETVNVAIPLTDFASLPAASGDAGFFQLNIGMNGDWGLDPATFFFDNFRLVQVLEEPRLTLTVDTTGGGMEVSNASGQTIDFSYYQILSDGNSLSPSGWDSLDSQNVDAIGPGPGQSWLAGGNPSVSDLSEAFLLGSTSIADGGTPLDLGNAYNSAIDARDIVFQYRDPNRPTSLLNGIVEYEANLTADFDGDEDVDGDDFAALALAYGLNADGDTDGDSDTDGADILNWQRQFTGPAELTGSVVAVPEPASLAIVAIGALLMSGRTRRVFRLC